MISRTKVGHREAEIVWLDVSEEERWKGVCDLELGCLSCWIEGLERQRVVEASE